MHKPLSELAVINPYCEIPRGFSVLTPVSFIPMSDVNESGHWFYHQIRPLGSVLNGFTSFVEGDVLVAKITPCMENGKGTLAKGLENGIGFGSTEFHVLRARSGTSSRFLFHTSQSKKFRTIAETFMIGSAGQQRVQRQFFDAYLVPNLSFDEQEQIANILDTLDTTIRQTEAIIAKLQQVKQGLLHDLLTRGINANGQLRPPVEQAPHLYKESPLGWIPREWEIRTLDEISESLIDGPFGSNLKTEHYVSEAGVRVVRLQNIQEGKYNDRDKTFISFHHAQELTRNTVNSGDVLIAALGEDRYPVGRACCYPLGFPFAINKADCFRFRCAETIGINEYVMNYLNSFGARRQIKRFEQGVTRKRINLSNIRSVFIPIPSVHEQRVICAVICNVARKIEASELEFEKLSQQKSALMDDLLTGRVRVTALLAQVDASP